MQILGLGHWGRSAGFENGVRIDEGPDLLGLLGSSLSQLQMQFGLYLLPEFLNSWQPLKVTCPGEPQTSSVSSVKKPRSQIKAMQLSPM